MPLAIAKSIKSLMKSKPALRTALKLTAGGVGAGGLGYGAHQMGYRRGANRMSDAMATAFAEQNAIENAGIVRRFNDMNKIENSQIANQAFRAGLMRGLASRPATMAKISSLSNDGFVAFIDELEKIALSGKAISKTIKAAKKTIGKLVTKGSARKKYLKQAIKTVKSKKFKKMAPYIGAGAAGGAGVGYMAGTDERTVTVKHKRA